MKNISLFILFLLCTQCQNNFPPTTLEITDKKIEAHFTRAATKSQLDSIQQVLTHHKIQLEYTILNWDNEVLSEMEFKVIVKNQYGIARSNFVNLRGKHFGFMIDLKDDNNFLVGDISK